MDMHSPPGPMTPHVACSTYAPTRSWPCIRTTTSFAASRRWHFPNPVASCWPATTISTATFGTQCAPNVPASWPATTIECRVWASPRTAWPLPPDRGIHFYVFGIKLPPPLLCVCLSVSVFYLFFVRSSSGCGRSFFVYSVFFF
jgi:hypothetical protein